MLESTTARLFFAMWPNPSDLIKLDDLAKSLKPEVTGIWILRANWHITLSFLGQVELARLPELYDLAGKLGTEPFSVKFDQIECWGGNRVLCLVATEPPPVMMALNRDLASALRALEVAQDPRAYRPHLTLVRNPTCHAEGWALAEPFTFEASSFALVQSRQSVDGSLYTTLRSWELQQSD